MNLPLLRRVRVSRFVQKCRNPIEQLLASLVDDIGVAGVGNFDPVWRRGEGAGEPACFIDRDDGVVGSMEDQRGAGDLSCRIDGPGGVDRHARQLAGPASDQPGHELRKGYHPPPQHERHRHVEVDHGRFQHQCRERRFRGGRSQWRWRLPSSGPTARVEKATRDRCPQCAPKGSGARHGYHLLHGRRMSKMVRRSCHNLANRAPPRSSRAGSRRPRGEPRARTTLRRTHEEGPRSFP